MRENGILLSTFSPLYVHIYVYGLRYATHTFWNLSHIRFIQFSIIAQHTSNDGSLVFVLYTSMYVCVIIIMGNAKS